MGVRAGGRVRPRAAVAVLAALIGAAAIVLLHSSRAAALSLPTPWDGVNPYHCTVQNAGTGTKVADPGADPYCVAFDKTQQNLTQLGLVTFLMNEPARVAAAVPKCFYFQEDHWRASVIQSDGQTVLYEFVGHYFINQATGDGGAWITRFSLLGHVVEPSGVPHGAITHDDVPVVARCAALARRDPGAIYADPAAPVT